MSKDMALLQLEFAAAELRRYAMSNRQSLSEADEYRLMAIRLDLQGAAEMGGQIKEYIDGNMKKVTA